MKTARLIHHNKIKLAKDKRNEVNSISLGEMYSKTHTLLFPERVSNSLSYTLFIKAADDAMPAMAHIAIMDECIGKL